MPTHRLTVFDHAMRFSTDFRPKRERITLASRLLSGCCPNNRPCGLETSLAAMMETIINHGRLSNGAAVIQFHRKHSGPIRAHDSARPSPQVGTEAPTPDPIITATPRPPVGKSHAGNPAHWPRARILNPTWVRIPVDPLLFLDQPCGSHDPFSGNP